MGFKSQITKLIDVKSIVTLVLTGVFSYLSILKEISVEQFLMVFTMCVSFFFGVKSGKREANEDQESEQNISE